MPVNTAEIRYDPAQPPLAILTAADLLALNHPAAASSSSSSPSSAPAPVHVQLLPTAGVATPTLTFPNDESPVVGVSYILRYLGRLSASTSASHLYGSTAVDATLIDYFLDLAPLCANKDTLNKYADTLNAHLAHRTLLVGEAGISVADLYVYEQITSNPRWANFSKTSSASYPHLLRWISLLSNYPVLQAAIKVKQQLEKQKTDAKILRSSEGAGFDVDLGSGAAGGLVVTRFPPEPSGYLHIGHAKAAMLNDAIAKKYGGKMILRFDDTNPQKEKEEYVENIMADLKTLGVEHHVLTHTSDHFDLILNYGTQMLKENKAYIDNTPVDQMRQMRGDGIESPGRSASVEENLRLWKEMQDGSPEGLLCCMRAKIDMKANNRAMRDPTMFRCQVKIPHHRTGTKYKVYPTYDFACPIVDSIEGVTVVLRTDEYRDRNEQFYWMIDALGLRKPFIRDYSRLNFVYTVLSKRKLQWFVDTKRVTGWNDARFPTVQGILRRGMTVEALREFILGQGFSMSSNMMEWDKIWTINKRHIDPVAPRFTAITSENCATLEITNVDGKQPEIVTVQLHPKNPQVGNKVVTRSNRVIIEQDDAKLIKQGEEVTLMNWGNVIVNEIQRNGDVITLLKGTYNAGGDPKKTDKKLTWLDAHASQVADAVPVSFIELDTLVTVPKIEEGVEFESVVNPKTIYETLGRGEPAMRTLQKGAILQVSRRGFFIVEALPSVDNQSPMQLIFIPDGKVKNMSTLSTKVDKAKLAGK